MTTESVAKVRNAPDLAEPAKANVPRPTSREQKTSVGSQLTTSVICDLATARALAPAWAELHDRSATLNPFTHPNWALTWAEQFLPDGTLHILALRRGEHLVGVAPFYWTGLGRRRTILGSLRLLGNGRCAQFTEVPGILTEAHEHRSVLQAVIAFLQSETPPWDWVKLTLDPAQGWFEPQWLARGTKKSSSFEFHHATRASVCVDLPATWDEFLANRKRNVRESIRRSFNRLDKRIGDWTVDPITDGREMERVLCRIIDLHEARSNMQEKPKHPTMFSHASAKSFYLHAVEEMARVGFAEASVLRCRGENVAGLVALRAGSQVFVSITGADPMMWDFGPGTVLIAELARREILRGTTSINLSGGPNQSKLRWSEHLEFNHDFVIAGPTLGARVRCGAYLQLSNIAALHSVRQWNTRDVQG